MLSTAQTTVLVHDHQRPLLAAARSEQLAARRSHQPRGHPIRARAATVLVRAGLRLAAPGDWHAATRCGVQEPSRSLALMSWVRC